MKELQINLEVYKRPAVRRLYRRLKKDKVYRESGLIFGIHGKIIKVLCPVEYYDDFTKNLTEALAKVLPDSNITHIKGK